MQYLYSGGCHSLNVVAPNDVLELMAAASFFQLDGLLRHTEARCSQIIDIDNVVPTYIHANVSNQFTFTLRTLKRNVAISLFVDRFTVLQSFWNFVKDFCSKIWSPCSRTASP